MLVATSVVATLAWKVTDFINKKNGFVRKIKPETIKISNVKDRPLGITKICGITNQSVYFQLVQPGYVFVSDIGLKSMGMILLNFPMSKEKNLVFDTHIDSPKVNIFLGNKGLAFSGTITDSSLKEYSFGPKAFTRSISVPDNLFVIRAFEMKNGKAMQNFFKFNNLTGKKDEEKTPIINDTIAGIASDGLLHYDKINNLLTYVYYYHNGFVTLDTNLNLAYKGKTVDTLYTFQTVTNSSAKSGVIEYTNFAPSRKVNKISCVDNGKLYNNSSLKADNESRQDYINKDVIDVYTLKDGSYTGSYYIPTYKGERLQQFKVFDKIIVALYEDYIVTYSIK